MTTYPMKLTCTKCGATDEGTLHIPDEPVREWVGLTNKDIYQCEPKTDWYDSVEFALAIEAKLKEKNGF